MSNTCPLAEAGRLLKGIGTPACESWRTNILARHTGIIVILAKQYFATAERNGHAAANRELARCDRELKLGRTGLYIHAGDSEIRDYCKAKTRNLERDFTDIAQRFNVDYALHWMKEELIKAGLTLPLKEKHANNRDAQLSAVARAICPKWWRRQLRTIAGRSLEQFLRERGQVCRQRSAYVSAQGLGRRAVQKSRNRKLLASLEAISDQGDTVNLADAADASVSNPENRRTELMVRMRGYEEIAGALGYQGDFLTLTCPSKYHPVLHKTGTPNPKYNGTDPREAQDYLTKLWAGIRSAWHKAGIRAFGFRVAEPHHDGTPHWHLLLFFPPEQCEKAWEIFRAYALAEDGDEWRAADVRAQRVTIDPSLGSATGYLAKYISKNIDGFQVGEQGDLEAEVNSREGARRVDAWSGIWGIRQFQQIGSTSVTVWREFRRIREALEDSHPKILEQIRQAADAGEWARFIELMGGALVTRDGQTVRAWMVRLQGENSYAEVTERIKGLILRGASLAATIIKTRNRTWSIQRAICARIEPGDPPTGPPRKTGRIGWASGTAWHGC